MRYKVRFTVGAARPRAGPTDASASKAARAASGDSRKMFMFIFFYDLKMKCNEYISVLCIIRILCITLYCNILRKTFLPETVSVFCFSIFEYLSVFSLFFDVLYTRYVYIRAHEPPGSKKIFFIFWNFNRCIDLKRASFFHLFVYLCTSVTGVRVLVRGGTLGGVRCSQVD